MWNTNHKIKLRMWFTVGSTLGYFWVEHMNLHPIVLAVVGLIAVICYAMGIWEWAGQFQCRNRANKRNQELYLRAALMGLFLGICILAFVWYHQLVPMAPSEQQQLIERYKNILGTSDIPNKTALIELTNKELKSKGTRLYEQIKNMNSYYHDQLRALQVRRERGEIDEQKYNEIVRENTARAAQEYESKFRTDARMILLELRNRIPYERRKHIVGLPNLNPADKRAGQVSLYDVLPGVEFGLFYSEMLAREIEELVKLLPA